MHAVDGYYKTLSAQFLSLRRLIVYFLYIECYKIMAKLKTVAFGSDEDGQGLWADRDSLNHALKHVEIVEDEPVVAMRTRILQHQRDLPLVEMGIYSGVKMDQLHLNDVMIEIRASLGVARKRTKEIMAEIENEDIHWAVMESFYYFDLESKSNGYMLVALGKGARASTLSLVVCELSADIINGYLALAANTDVGDDENAMSLFWCCKSDKNAGNTEDVKVEFTSEKVLNLCRSIVINKLVTKGIFIKKKY